MSAENDSSLGSSDYDVLIENEGGAVKLVALPEAHERELWGLLREASSEIPFDTVEKMLRPFGVEWPRARKHWPWIALAARAYRLNKSHAQKTQDRAMKPTEVRNTLRRIGRLSKQLHAELMTIKASATLVGEPLFTQHVQTVLELLILGAAGFYDEVEIQHPGEHHREFLATLARLPAAAEFAESCLRPNILRKKGGGGDPALPDLVAAAKRIWLSMTDRTPSVNRVSAKSRPSDVPDFVLFVQAIASLSVAVPHLEKRSVPTPSQIATAFRSGRSG